MITFAAQIKKVKQFMDDYYAENQNPTVRSAA